MKVLVQQIGARMDYAVARALHSSGNLAGLVTDLYFERPPIKKLGRYSSNIPLSEVSRDNLLGLAYRWQLSRKSYRSWPHLRMAEEISARTVSTAKRTGAKVCYGFDTAMLPSMRTLKDAGITIVMEQCIAPRSQYLSAMKELSLKLRDEGIDIDTSGLQASLSYASMLMGIERQEWQYADHIFCPSSFVADALQAEGVVRDKIHIIPYGVTLPERRSALQNKAAHDLPSICFVGGFSWRKGAYEFCQLAKSFAGKARFNVYGKLLLPEETLSQLGPNVEFHGHLPRHELHESLAQSDILVLPSYSEGSATAVYEAMALGLACIVSEATGSIITHNVDGIIVQAGDDASIIEATKNLIEDRAFRNQISGAALLTAKRFTRETYGERLVARLREITNA